jgi:phenylpropionate dioxygenase-like ring-hydroxylating dioxygenase large terminal subunit
VISPAQFDIAADSAKGAAPGLDDPLLSREWFLIAWSSEVELGRPLPRRALGRDLVLWRSSQGLHCWLDLCIHRGARLSLGAIRMGSAPTGPNAAPGNTPDCLICPYHAWEYAPSGQCVRIPAHPGMTPPPKAHARVFAVRERYGAVWVCLRNPEADPETGPESDPETDLPEFPFAETSGFRTVTAGPYRFRALGPRVVENFLDVAHLGFVHAGLLGDPARLEIDDYEVTDGPHGPVATEIRIWQPNPDGTGRGAVVTYRYWVAGPLTVGLEKVDSDRRFAILAQVTPVDHETSEMRMLMSINHGAQIHGAQIHGASIADAELRAFQDTVAEQDRVVVESQRPELLPLDLQAELHLRSDRMAIAYRKWLRKIGLRYGAA